MSDSTGGGVGFFFDKESLVPGVNVLPLMLDFPGGNGVNDLDRSDVVSMHFFPQPVDLFSTWDGIYFGRMHVLAEQAHFRPARAKIELEDIDNVYPQSLYGSELTFTDPDGEEEVFTGDETYNTFGVFSPGVNAYVPNLYKIQLTAGSGTEGFNRNQTAENLRVELDRQGSFLKTQVVNNLSGGEVYVDVFSPQFSTTGDRNTLEFAPDPSNPYVPDLISVTSFAGGLEGQNTRLGGGTGNLAIAQQFEVTGGSATLRFAELFLHRIGSPAGSLMATIHADNPLDPLAGTAPGILLSQATDRFASDITDGVPNYELFHFGDEVLAPGIYWIQISGDAAYEASNDAENHVIWGMSSVGSILPSAVADGTFTSGSLWAVSGGIHHFFKVIGDA
jgi:hypothetical protein